MNSLIISSALDETTNILETDLSILSAKEQEDWLRRVGDILSGWDKLEDFSLRVQSKILYLVYSNWEEKITTLAKAPWDNDFMKWAKAFTRSRGKEPSEITIKNKISVFRDWEGCPIIECPEYVIINGEEVPFKVEDIDYSKKLIARATARQGKLTPEGWSILVDPSKTVDDLLREMKEITMEPDEFFIVQEGSFICGIRNGKKVAVAVILDENREVGDDLFDKTLKHLLTRLGLSIPIEYY